MFVDLALKNYGDHLMAETGGGRTGGWSKAEGVVRPGHRVASGAGGDPRYPEGTIHLQRAFIEERGVSLEGLFDGTINVSVAPLQFTLQEPRATLASVAWTRHIPPETFSFCDCRLTDAAGRPWRGLVYYPHPETKPEHFKTPDILEILMPRIPGLQYGDRVTVEVPEKQGSFVRPPRPQL